MSFIQSFFIAVGLAMDAFAVSISNGLSMKKVIRKKAVLIGGSFGFFQAAMPVLGYAAGNLFSKVIKQFDHYIALVLLVFIGTKMLYDGIRNLRSKDGGHIEEGKTLSPAGLIIQSFATSIDALVVGISFIAMGMSWFQVWISAFMIGAITCGLSIAGVYMGRKFGGFLGSKAEIAGGLILIAIGLKIFIEHTFFG